MKHNVKYCPMCMNITQVVDVRDKDRELMRRRKCPKCGHRFTTIEMMYEEVEDKKRVLTLADRLIREVKRQILEENEK